MSHSHNYFAPFQQFGLQKVNAGDEHHLEELFDLWLIEHPTHIEHAPI